ncbi:MAG: hypothetical protein AAGK00_19595 [Pseudomonadota bacterium]
MQDVSGFDCLLAGELMTLAAIAYAGDQTGSLPDVKTEIQLQLADTAYATKGAWQLVWGPIRGRYGDNLAYVAQKGSDPVWAIVLRGTVMHLDSWWEDVPTGQKPFPYITDAETRVSNHFFAGLNGLLETADGPAGTLEAFMKAATAGADDITVYTTGHSPGGGLAPMFLAWAMAAASGWSQRGSLTSACYAFAPPTSGNPAFATWIGKHAQSYQVCNPLDVVPLGYSAIGAAITHQIPDRVQWRYYPEIWAAEGQAWASGPWQQPATVETLAKIQLPSSIGYFDQVGAQHNHNSYLWLLGAPETTVGDPSILPHYASTK